MITKPAFSFMFVMVFFTVFTAAHAQSLETASLSGTSYKTYIYCTGDAGDYCEGNSVISDRFEFDGSDFVIESMNDALWGFGAEGDYSDNGFMFNADFEAINDSFEKYKFSIRGINLFDQFILGIMEINYYEWEIIDFDKKDEAEAYFVGSGPL